ncbi:hypothetical protein BDW74DRAFT_164309 [Aspergillus multicolor]|uniref:uncharacterized protein n=1 Tax=Aspergillus multicolor TaxID=41759 RepID=UPI003CCDFAA2
MTEPTKPELDCNGENSSVPDASTAPSDPKCDSADPSSEESSNPQTDYTQRLECRLSELEKIVRQLQASVEHKDNDEVNKTDDSSDEKSNHSGTTEEDKEVSQAEEIIVTKPEVFRASYIGFWHRHVDDEYHAFETHVQDYAKDGDTEDNFQRAMETMNASAATDYIRTNRSTSNTGPIRCARINSTVVLNALREANPTLPGKGTSLVFFSPFAPLVESHEHMKKTLENLQERASSAGKEPDDKEKGEDETKGEGEDDAQQAIRHLTCFMNLMDSDILSVVHRLRSSSPDTKISFWELYYLFRADEDLYYPAASHSRSDDPLQFQKLWRMVPQRDVRHTDEENRSKTDHKLYVKCYYLDFDGSSYVPVVQDIGIAPFEGQRNVTSLPIYPLRFAPNSEHILRESRDAGQKFVEAIDQKHMTYHGWAVRHRESTKRERGFVSSNVIIDCDETFKAHPDWKPVPISTFYHGKGEYYEVSDPSKTIQIWQKHSYLDKLSDVARTEWHSESYLPFKETEAYLKKQAFLFEYEKRQNNAAESSSEKQELLDDDLVLLPWRLFAYSLQDRRFIILDTANLKRLEEIGDPFRDLIISPHHKNIIWSLVHSHFEKKRMEQSHSFYDISQDIIHNKGRGLIVLLHGVPGVGKTSTAEAVAHKWKKPLLAITCGDLGLEASEVEQSLKDIFRLAQLWDCVLLLDEADVFLSQRLPSDLQRNSLVSVFLRVLEYYSGILFLTTNRVGNMDEAFKSRIHIGLYYPPLNLNQTKKIWRMNLTRLTAIEEERHNVTGKPKLTIATDDILEYAVEHFEQNKAGKAWNGRQIRNAFLTAAALARYEQQSQKDKEKPQGDSTHDIRRAHFKVVAEASSGFDEYLRETRGKSDADIARYAGARADHITRATPLQSPPATSDQDSTYPRQRTQSQNPGYYPGEFPDPRRESDPRLSPYHTPDPTAGRRGPYQYSSPSQSRQSIPPELDLPHRFGSQESVERGSGNFGTPGLNYGSQSQSYYPEASRPRTPQPFSSAPMAGRGPIVQADVFDYPDDDEFRF